LIINLKLETNQVDLPANQTLDLQANHANGSVIRLKEISFQEDNIVADLAITNGHNVFLNIASLCSYLHRYPTAISRCISRQNSSST
jgi:hypothetical protein